MKQKIKSFISLKATSAMFGLLFFVALAGGMVINASMASAAAPTLASAIFADDALKVGETSLVTFTFSEAISDFTNDDLTIANGTLTTVIDVGAGTIWTATFTPTDDLEDATNVIIVDMTGITDSAANAGVGSTDSSNYAIDTKEPTVALTYTADPAKAGAMIITAIYSEVIVGTPAISINQPGSTDISAVNMTSSDQTIWTYSYTVIAADGSTYIDGTAIVSLSTVADAASNNAVAPTNTTFTIDTIAPVMISAVYKDVDNDGIVDSIDVTYSEDIGSSTFTKSEWSFPIDSNPHNLDVDSVLISPDSTTDVRIAIASSDSEDLIAINDTIVEYTATTTGGIIDGATNYAVDAELPVSVEDDKDEDNIEGEPKSKQPNPNSGVTLYRMGDDPRVYVIKNKKKRWIKTAREFERNGYNWDEIQEISAELLEEFPEAEALVTELLRAIGDHRVYRLEEGKKSWIKTAKEFEDCGYDWGNIQEVSPETLASYQNLVSSGLLRAIGNNKVYKLENGKKRWIKTAGEFNAAGHRWGDVEDVDAETLDDYPDSE